MEFRNRKQKELEMLKEKNKKQKENIIFNLIFEKIIFNIKDSKLFQII